MVVILNDYDFSVAFKEGYVKRREQKPAHASPATKDEPKPKQNRRRDRWESTTLTRALHEEAAKDFQLCLVLNVMALLGVSGFDLERDEGGFDNHDPTNRIFSERLRELFDQDRELLTDSAREGGAGVERKTDDPDRPYLPSVSRFDEDVSHIFKTLKALDDNELQGLFSRLTATLVSHTSSDAPWNTEVKRLVAKETGLEVQAHFDASDKGYLSLHTKAELSDLAQEAGNVLDVSALKKAAAVDYLAQHDKVRAYLPERLLPKAA